jgi:hypothetical protein
MARHVAHEVVKMVPPTLHLLVGYDGLIGLAFEVESLEGWHAVILSLGWTNVENCDVDQI